MQIKIVFYFYPFATRMKLKYIKVIEFFCDIAKYIILQYV